MMNWFFRWWFKGKIAYLERMMISDVVDSADIRYLGYSEDWWYGRAKGIDTALKILELIPFEGEKIQRR